MLAVIEKNFAADATVISDLQSCCTAAQLQARSVQILDQLARYEVNSLGLYAANSIDWVMVDLACQRADHCIVPIPTFFSTSQIEHTLNSCQLDAFVTDDPELMAVLPNINCHSVGKLAGTELELILLCKHKRDLVRPQGTGKITFSSGSTGQPKGVCLSHGQLKFQADALRQSVALSSPRHLCLLPLSTLLENVAGIYAPLLAGGEIIIPAQRELGFEGSALVDQDKFLVTISTSQPDSIILVPQLLLLLVAAISKGWKPPDSLKFIAVGGSKVSMQLLSNAIALGLPVFEGYGLSECCSVVSLNTPSKSEIGSCGKPLQHLELSFDEGEVCVSGNTMLGYVNEPTSWNSRFIRTGDLGHLDHNGFLHIDGRKKNVLISSFGRNISPEWVESELLANPMLFEAVVVGDARPHCSALLSVRDAQTNDAELQYWIDLVNAKLPDYARIKRWHRTALPLSKQEGLLTENGRPIRQAINAVYAAEIESLY